MDYIVFFDWLKLMIYVYVYWEDVFSGFGGVDFRSFMVYLNIFICNVVILILLIKF